MVIHTTTTEVTLVDGYVYLTDCPVGSITATTIPAHPNYPTEGYTVVKIEAASRKLSYTNDIKTIALPVMRWLAKDTDNKLINLNRIKKVIGITGKLATDSVTDTAKHKEYNLRYLVGGDLKEYETGYTIADRRGGTFSYVKKRTFASGGSTASVTEKFMVACMKFEAKELGSIDVNKIEVIIQLIEGKDQLKGS